jgi:hypothetical protein
MAEHKNIIETLNQLGAILASGGIEFAIKEAEKSISTDDEWIKKCENADYVRKCKAETKSAIEQPKRLRAVLNGRVFDAYKEENPDYVI